MLVYRIVREKYANALSVPGVAARWNRADEYVLYAASSRSLATLELLVNGAVRQPTITYKVMVLRVPDVFQELPLDVLPPDWRTLSAYTHLQALGSLWYTAQESLMLKVPSAVIPREANFLINTRHPDFTSQVKIDAIEDYFWDVRLT